MPRSFLNQLLQVSATASANYDDAIGSVHTGGVAEAQDSLEGDLNVLRSLTKDLAGTTNWYDEVDLSVQGISGKFFLEQIAPAGFSTGTAIAASGSTNAFDTAIQTITNHNDGGGNSTTEGVVVNSTKAYRIEVRDHATQNPFDDGNNNEVYGRLSWSGTEYVITWYSWVSGTETPYSFASGQTVDISSVLKSAPYKELTWDIFTNNGWHDVSGIVGTLADDNVVVDGMTDFLSGLTTQATVNARVDELGVEDTAGQGAYYIGIDDSATGSNGYFTGTDVMNALTEVSTQLGGDTSGTFDFTEENVLADNDAVYSALNKLDLQWGDLFSTANGEGASLIGVEDAGGYFTSTNVEGSLQEIGQALEDVSGWEKTSEVTSGAITSGTPHTVPNSLTYTPDGTNPGANMDVYLNGQLLLAGAGNDYTETTGTTITFTFTVPNNAIITYAIRK